MNDTIHYPLADHVRVYRNGRVESCPKPGCIGGKETEWHTLTVQGPKRGGYPQGRFPKSGGCSWVSIA
jgi:hypothetical protein